MLPGNAILPNGVADVANREIGVPGESGKHGTSRNSLKPGLD